MTKRKSPKKNKLTALWGIVWPILLTQGVRVMFDILAASISLQPVLHDLPRVILA